MKSVMSHAFSRVPTAEIPRSSFDRSHGHKTSFSSGVLIPVLIDEALPGDTFNLRMTAFCRLATPIYPIMDNLFMDSHFFSIPLRLVWDNWKKLNGEQDNPGDSTDFTVPQMVSPATTGYAALSLADYMGIPTGVPDLSHSALFHRAVHLTWNEWFRDQNLQNTIVVPKGDGPDAAASFNNLLRRGKRHDYFTSCLPWPQKGAGVLLPLGTSAPVVSDGAFINVRGGTGAMTQLNPALATPSATIQTSAGTTQGGQLNFGAAGTATTGLRADLQAASSATINSLRQSFQIQKILERDARGGTRYYEMIKAHFGVTDPGHAVLQRPVYLGGGTTPISITPIPQTSASGAYADSPQGNLAAYGTVAAHNQGFTASFTEHCIILGFVSVRADLTYQQGLNRMFSRKTRYDFYLPALSHIGEQSVLNKEIYAVGSAVVGQDDLVFGYQERHADYRYKPSIITGIFRSNHPQSLDPWHLSQDFSTLPLLNASFIEEHPPIDRVIAVPTEPEFIGDFYFKMLCARPMPIYGVPGNIDRF